MFSLEFKLNTIGVVAVGELCALAIVMVGGVKSLLKDLGKG